MGAEEGKGRKMCFPRCNARAINYIANNYEGSCSDTTIFAGEATTKFPSLCQNTREGGLVFS